MRGTAKSSALNTAQRTIRRAGKKKKKGGSDLPLSGEPVYIAGRRLCCQVNPVACCMLVRDYDSVQPCSGHIDFCKEHLVKRMNTSKAIESFVLTMCANCLSNYRTTYTRQVLNRKPQTLKETTLSEIK